MNDTSGWPVRISTWFAEHRRRMPWRDHPTPYRVWISEIMLQQTRVDTVIPYFERFVREFPDVGALADASLDAVLKLWEGLGYYARARNLHRAAGRVVARHGGRLPGDVQTLRTLPGLGEYTAAAIASIGYGVALPVLDGNVLRVVARFRAIDADITRTATRRAMTEYLASRMDGTDPGVFNQALMELGALVCRPVGPDCPACPLGAECRARRRNRVADFPVKPVKRPVPHYDVGVGIVRRRDGKILIARRKVTGMLGGLWEFPGGKRRGNEAVEETVRREVLEETGIAIRVGAPLGALRHAYSHFRITLHAFHARHVAGRARALAADKVRWVRDSELDAYAFPAANRKLISMLHSQASHDR